MSLQEQECENNTDISEMTQQITSTLTETAIKIDKRKREEL